jgi:mRNA-degrading endonuclease RelE of RelBE toxin-antitoxin system
VRLAAPARRSLDRIEGPDQRRVQAALREMALDPFQGNIKLLTGPRRIYRRRVGSWRIFFFRVLDDRAVVITAIERRTSTTY